MSSCPAPPPSPPPGAPAQGRRCASRGTVPATTFGSRWTTLFPRSLHRGVLHSLLSVGTHILTLNYRLTELRFTHQDIRTLLQYFALDEVIYRYGYKCAPETALCVVLFRLSAPSRYKELMYIFQRSRGWLCTVFNDTVEHLVSQGNFIKYT
jgi:hypothetical protein